MKARKMIVAVAIVVSILGAAGVNGQSKTPCSKADTVKCDTGKLTFKKIKNQTVTDLDTIGKRATRTKNQVLDKSKKSWKKTKKGTNDAVKSVKDFFKN